MKRVLSACDFGATVRARRKELGYSQQQLAAFCGCGARFISDLENGKDTIQLGKAMDVASMLGLNMHVEEREALDGARRDA
ncbi:helix-turn-helix transcriptional regulator [Arabiibacter massiliensis]|uniref:helix-turn-helix transcriptional regulator n=1 Tax=Arabiibacter massiliensis TaxID=1870985 RepID=UPI0009BA90B5|nr:helix-turn-helix transcriptional regulator [Arabiibacter massiliensis]